MAKKSIPTKATKAPKAKALTLGVTKKANKGKLGQSKGLGVSASPYIGKTLGGKDILSVSDIEINGRAYLSLSLSDNTTTVLSEADLKAQAE